LFPVVFPAPIAIVGTIVGLAIVGLTIANRRHLVANRLSVGA
jgi:hypothetical protein